MAISAQPSPTRDRGGLIALYSERDGNEEGQGENP